MVFGIVNIPLRLVRIPFSVALIILGFRHRRTLSLPVAGLDEAKAQAIYFALKRAATNHQQEQTALQWLGTLQLAQVASTRIISELDIVEVNLEFWTQRLDSGRHFWFSLLRHGPSAFGHKLFKLIKSLHHRILLRTRNRHVLNVPSRNQENSIQGQLMNDDISDAELVEKRVLILRLLQGELSEAVASISHAASLLYLNNRNINEEEDDGPNININDNNNSNSGYSARGDGDGALFETATQRIHLCIANIAQTFTDLEKGVHSVLDAQQGPEGSAARDRSLLSQAVGRILGIGSSITAHRRHRYQEDDTPPSDHHIGHDHQIQDTYSTHTSGILPANDITFSAQKAVGFTPLLPAQATVHSALKDARRAALIIHRNRSNRIVPLPVWLQMPSQAQRNWVRYSVICVAVGYGTLFLIRHSRLAGSQDLDNWIRTGVQSVQSAWAEHVIGPLERVRQELFNTFRHRPAIVSMQEYEADRDSLQRMLDDFKSDYIKRHGRHAAMAVVDGATTGSTTNPPNGTSVSPPSSATSADDQQLLQGMEIMMRSYEKELKSPVRNLVSGDLMRSLLIQVQKLKVDTESAMLEIDQILRANELSISLVAAVPAFLVAGAVLYSIGTAVTPAPPDPRREAVAARMAMIETERALEALAKEDEEIHTRIRDTKRNDGDIGNNDDDGNVGRGSKESEGMLIYRLSVAYAEAEELFRRHRGMLRSASDAEWSNVRSDLLELAAPGAAVQKLRTAARMMRVYAIYQQF